MAAREMRRFVPVEVAAFLAVALAPLPVPRVVPLLVVASVSYMVRGGSFPLRGPGLYAAIGAAAGLAALALALIAGAPVVETLTAQPVEWSVNPVVRGSGQTFLIVAVVVGVSALAAELVLRGWVVERILELGGSVVPAVLAGGIAEALVTDGNLGARIGGCVFGLGLGWIYVAADRGVMAPMCARITFVLGATALESLKLIG
jgi:hypothetical protein